eukprot:gb/GECH01007938.1/.p1 GENE.gb/GECH01007938.1/~~gb/GECH01007938.1/.p1  ORF type:complete len:354 (+),score=46.27 gb/GECH01007938.1/:1-1062(+)
MDSNLWESAKHILMNTGSVVRRNTDDIDTLYEAFGHLHFFSRTSTAVARQMLGQARYLSLPAGETVTERPNHQDSLLYIIIDGIISISTSMIPSSPSPNSSPSSSYPASSPSSALLRPGDVFSPHILSNIWGDSPLFQCRASSYLLVVPCTSTVIRSIETQIIDTLHTLRSLQVPVFRSVSDMEILPLALALRPQHIHGSNTLLYRQGCRSPGLYILCSGTIRLLREAEERTSSVNPTRRVIEYAVITEKEFMGDNGLRGVLREITDDTRATDPARTPRCIDTAVTRSREVEVLLLEVGDLKERMPVVAGEAILRYAEGYPGDGELMTALHRQQQWQRDKKRILNDVIASQRK